MSTTLRPVVQSYARVNKLTPATISEHQSTVRKWHSWGKSKSIDNLTRKEIREFLEWVYERAIGLEGTNPERTVNKSRENLKAVLSWAWEREMIHSLPSFPKPMAQRDVAGRHYFSKAELNRLYFATHRMKRPRGWNQSLSVGHYWRCALVLFFNYGFDTGTLWQTKEAHKPILWRQVSWDSVAPVGQSKMKSRWGWLSYQRVKTGKKFCRPLNRIAHAHLKSIQPEYVDPDLPVLMGGSCRPNHRFQQLCEISGIKPKIDIHTGEEKPWLLKDLRKTCATHYDAHIPESSIEILGHSMSGVTYRHYAHRDPLAFKAIMTIPQPSAFKAILNENDCCPCCQRTFS